MKTGNRPKIQVLICALALSTNLVGLTQEPFRDIAKDPNSNPLSPPAEQPPDHALPLELDLPLEIDIEKAKNLAVDSSDRLKDAAFQLQASTQLARLDIRERLPRITVGYSGSDTVFVGTQDSRLKSAGITITQPLFNGGLWTGQKRLANLQLRLYRQDYEKLKDAILDEITHLFQQRIIGSEKHKLQTDIYSLALADLEIAKIQFEGGAITELELIETELEVKNLELNLKATQSELQNLDYQLKEKMGIGLDDKVNWKGAVDADYSGIPLLGRTERLCEIALENNPEIKSQQFAIHRVSEELKAARQTYLPKVDAEASFSVSGESFPLQEPGFSISLIVSFPGGFFPLETSFSLGARGRLSTTRGLAAEGRLMENISSPISLKLTKQALEKERSRETELRNDLLLEIRKTVDQHSHLIEKISLQRAYLELEQKKLGVMNRQLEAGEIKRIDLLQARTRSFNNRIDLLKDVLRLLDQERSLEKLLGLEPGTLNHFFPEGDEYD